MKKQLCIYFAVFIITAGTAIAQKPETMKLQTGSKLLDAASVNNGLVLLTGNEFILRKNKNWKISYYNPDLSLRYEKPIMNPKLNYFDHHHLVVSPSGNNTFFVNHGTGTLFGGSQNKQTIMHVDSSGFASSFVIKKGVKYNKLNVIFADDDYLYYVEKERPKGRKKKEFPDLKYVRIAADKSVSEVPLKLPDPEADATEWSYLGHTDAVAYFVSRKINENGNGEEYRIGVVDGDGDLEDDFKLNASLQKGALRASNNHSSSPGIIMVHNNAYTVHTYTSGGNGVHSTTVVYTANPEAFGDIAFDPASNGFYIYGVSGPKEMVKQKMFARRTYPEVSDFYVFKFDQDGSQLWNYQGKMSGMDNAYKNKVPFVYRNVQLNFGQNGLVRFQSYINNKVYSYEINSQTGKFETSFSNQFQDWVTPVDLGTCRKSGDKSALGKFLSDTKKGDFSTLNFRLYSGNIVVQDYYTKSKIDLYRFPDE